LRRPYSARPGCSIGASSPLSAENGASRPAQVRNTLTPPDATYASTSRGRSLPPGVAVAVPVAAATTTTSSSFRAADARVIAAATAVVVASAATAKEEAAATATAAAAAAAATVPALTATETFYGRTGGGQYSIPFPTSSAALPRTYRGLQANEIQPSYIRRGGKADCQFTYHRPLSGLRGSYVPGSQYWQHPPDMRYQEHGISETAAKYPRKPRPSSAYAGGPVLDRYGSSGYGSNNNTGTIVDAANARCESWSSTYTDMHREVVASQEFDLGRSQRPRRPHSAHFGLVSRAGKLSSST